MSSNAGSHGHRREDRHGREHGTESNASSNRGHGEDRKHRSRSGSRRRSSASIAFHTDKTNSRRKTSAELTIGVGALEKDSESGGVVDRSASVRFGVQLFDESEEDGRKTKKQHPISSIGKSRDGKAGNGKERVLDESPRESPVSSIRSSRDDDDTGSSAISSRPTTPVPLVDPTAFGGENWQGNGSIHPLGSEVYPPPHGSTPNGLGHNVPSASIPKQQNAQNRASRSPERIRGDQFPQDSRDGSPASTSSTAGVLGVRQESPRASGAENSSQDGTVSVSSTTSSQGTIAKPSSPVPGKEGSKDRVAPSSNDGSNQSSPSRAPGSPIGPPPKKAGSYTSSQTGSNQGPSNQGPGSPRVKAPQTRDTTHKTGSPLNRSGVDGAGSPHTRSTRGNHPRDAQRARRSVADATLPGGALPSRHGERQHHGRDGGRRSPESSRTSTSESGSAGEEEDQEQGKKHRRRRRLVVGEETTVKGTKTLKVGINPDTGLIETKQDRKERENKGRELEKGEKGHGHGHHTERVTRKKTSTSWEFDPAEPSVTRKTSYEIKTRTRRSRDHPGEDGVGPGASR